MKRIRKGQGSVPYSLHDMNIIKLEAEGSKLNLKTQSGLIKAKSNIFKKEKYNTQIDGYVEFNDVQWEKSFIYIIGISADEGMYSGERINIREFMNRYDTFGISVMDEVYGNDHTKYFGYLIAGNVLNECIMEIYHNKDIVFVEI